MRRVLDQDLEYMNEDTCEDSAKKKISNDDVHH